MMLLGNPLGSFTADGWPTIVALNFSLVGAFLGIAEAARDLIVETAKTKRKQPFEVLLAERPATQFQIAEIEIGLAAARAALGRTGQAIDEWLERSDDEFTTHDVQLMMKDWQCTKLVVNRAAADVVDRAMAISGGLGYLASNPLSRMYRDVRAGPLMQPLSPNEAFEYIGRATLGLDPDAELREVMNRLREERIQPSG
jgi:alkylation response protein AidB-like acyl-CoA dehydrogenase